MIFGIRSYREEDRNAVEELLALAFPTPTESDLVGELRQAGDAVIELVATIDGRVCGHVMLSRLNAPMHALALAPVSVHPAHQGKRIGDRLVHQAIDEARGLGVQLLLALGEPEYHGRFGFSQADASGYDCVYAAHTLLALRLDPDCPREGRIIYAAPFNALG